MLHVAIRDLIFRRRRYIISLIGCGLVFGLSLIQTGLSDSFANELRNTVHNFGARSFAVPEGTSGPFTGARPVARDTVPAGYDPVAYLLESANPDHPVEVAAFGLEAGSGAEPRVTSGRQLRGPNDALVDDRSPFTTGSRITLGSQTFHVVGRVENFSLNAGMPGVVVPLKAMQASVFGGLDLVTFGIATGATVPPVGDGWRSVSDTGARDDALRLLTNARKSIDVVKFLLWLVAALVIGAAIYLSTIERIVDFAVFKAIGAATSSLAGGLAFQAVLVAVASSLIGLGVAVLLAPAFPLRVDLSVTAAVLLPVTALVVGLLASLFGLRRAVRVDPAVAFGGGLT